MSDRGTKRIPHRAMQTMSDLGVCLITVPLDPMRYTGYLWLIVTNQGINALRLDSSRLRNLALMGMVGTAHTA